MDPIQLAILRAERQDPRRTLIAPGNIDLNNRPTIPNPDGSVSTVRSESHGLDNIGEVLVPTAIPGRPGAPEHIANPDEALARYLITGRHLGIFSNPKWANQYAELLHQNQAAQYGGRR
jgi:hypothetical protein